MGDVVSLKRSLSGKGGTVSPWMAVIIVLLGIILCGVVLIFLRVAGITGPVRKEEGNPEEGSQQSTPADLRRAVQWGFGVGFGAAVLFVAVPVVLLFYVFGGPDAVTGQWGFSGLFGEESPAPVKQEPARRRPIFYERGSAGLGNDARTRAERAAKTAAERRAAAVARAEEEAKQRAEREQELERIRGGLIKGISLDDANALLGFEGVKKLSMGNQVAYEWTMAVCIVRATFVEDKLTECEIEELALDPDAR